MIVGSVSQFEAVVELGLLEGCRLTIDAIEGGEVRIETLQIQA